MTRPLAWAIIAPLLQSFEKTAIASWAWDWGATLVKNADYVPIFVGEDGYCELGVGLGCNVGEECGLRTDFRER